MKATSFAEKVCVHAKAKNVFVTGKDCAEPKKDDLTKPEISANHRRSTLLPKHQNDFVTANIAVIITQMQTVKKAFIRGSLQDLDCEEVASQINWFSEMGGHCRRVVVDTCVVTY